MFRTGRALLLDPAGTIRSGATAGTVESLDLVLDEVVPQLKTAVGKFS